MASEHVQSLKVGLGLAIITLEHIQWTRYALFSSTTLLFYDYLISFDMEVKLIWEKPWTPMKVVFLWLRYFGLLFVVLAIAVLMNRHLTDNFCSFWFRWETIGFSSLVITTEGVLLLWIYVVYDQDLKILIGMGLLFIAEIAAILVILLEAFPSLTGKAHFISGFGLCFPGHKSRFLNSFWIPVTAYHSVLLTLFLVMGYRIYGPVSQGYKETSKLLAMIYRASLFNFLVIFVAYLACAVIWLGEDESMSQIPVGFALAFCVTNCTRLLLNIRLAYHRYEEEIRPLTIEVLACHTPDFQFRSYGSETVVGDAKEEEIDVRTPLILTDFSRRQTEVEP